MALTAVDMSVEEETKPNLLGFAVLGVFGSMALVSQLLICCLWGALALLGFNAFEEE